MFKFYIILISAFVGFFTFMYNYFNKRFIFKSVNKQLIDNLNAEVIEIHKKLTYIDRDFCIVLESLVNAFKNEPEELKHLVLEINRRYSRGVN